ncbi:Hsp20/alpha crystallin family protein [Geomonas sp. Red69]|uniref:Hsp20/alpha crystallin family protein n=1 Tax=Geomonas diazotrophica TaxID=2843197 RepID=A0ABX8JKE8_9BACT|nr:MULTISPECIES: Hsp20/alpha crystallin family protein [Geomonas]MBU5635159.1 Hsp20/alpha crystallin family protein [Geomonas diazotrophica]QWV97792.1 Hsp20/alpha crystallin family protein [Geomonas nitrogeniifigens]QXE86932.1 Hsp20/alpha crystallin family protein [Geomonas nitrogeniifigens]
MAIVRYNPLSELRSMQDKMNRLLDLAWTREIGEEIREGVWHPPADVYESNAAVTIKVELPDLELDDIDIRAEDHTLTIKGERKHSEEIRKENFHRIERFFGPFQRSFAVPPDFDTTGFSASCDCGVLTIVIPKTITVEIT